MRMPQVADCLVDPPEILVIGCVVVLVDAA
jgi:hypothetical protein